MLNTYPTDLTYINAISYRLEGFKQINNVWNSRCCFCGDSKKQRKQRLFFYTKCGNLNVQCKNCGYSKSFYNFMKDFDQNLFEEYKKDVLLANFKTKKVVTSVKTKTSKKVEPKVVSKIECCSLLSLDKEHKAFKYMADRGFSTNEMKYLYYSDDFKSVASQLNKKSADKLLESEPRIIIPFYNESGEIKAIQGRSLNPKSKLRYITIKVDEENDKIYGIERLEPDKIVYAVEGPLDSLFINNCVAVGDANLESCSFADVLVFDNQCRNVEIVKLMDRAIKNGRSVVIWPNSTERKQDINDMIKMGVSKKMLMKVLEKRTFKGIQARIELSKWKRVKV